MNHTINDHPLGERKTVYNKDIEDSNVQIDFTNSIDSADITYSDKNDNNNTHDSTILPLMKRFQ
jgi:hypothetical protein